MTHYSPLLFRERRDALGISRFTLAVWIGMSSETVANYESGRSAPSAAVLGRAADALGCSVSDFFTRETADAAA